jgi:hypothetical protein
MVIDFGERKSSCDVVKSLLEASVKKVLNRPSTPLIKATSCVERSNTRIKAKEHSKLFSYQTLTTDKNCLSYQSPKKLVEKLVVMTANSC